MKFINKLFLILLVVGLGTTACENTELDLLDNPNAITPESASLNDLYNQVQLTYNGVYSGSQFNPGSLARMYHTGAFQYTAMTTLNTLNGLWNNAYAGLFPDVDALVALAEANGFDIHAGSAKIMKAHAMMILVDLMGDVPYSEATQGTDVISPVADDGSAVYAAAIALLDEAIAQLAGTTAGAPAFDNYYGGDAAKWVKWANTLKLKAALNQRLVDPSGSASTINSIASSGDYISSAADDFEYQYGAQRTNPNSRHPFYNNHYEIGDGNYQSTYYMWLCYNEKLDVDGIAIQDPRARYYFYQKVEDAETQDATTYSCIGGSALPDQSTKPAHWASINPRLPYCVIPGTGYSGRDHGNGSGIPPDGPIRTSYGLYPAGGQFDDNTFDDTRQAGTTGGLGAGVWPVWPSFFSDFALAEAALTIGTNGDARALLESAMRASFAKVEGFESLVPATMSKTVIIRGGGEGTVKELYGIDEDAVTSYVDKVLALYDAADADGKLDVVIKEWYIAAFGNGLEAYNMWRRTGKPNGMAPGLEADMGPFARTLLYPTDYITRNANSAQKSLSDQTFWDDGSTSLY